MKNCTKSEEARSAHQLASCHLEDSKATLKAILQHLNWFRILVGRWLRGSVYLLSLDNLETRHFVTTIAMRGKYDLPYYPGMEDLIDNLHIDLSIGKPVREVAIKLASILDTNDDYLNTMLQHDDIEVISINPKSVFLKTFSIYKKSYKDFLFVLIGQ